MSASISPPTLTPNSWSFFVLVGLMLVLVASESKSNVDATISTLMLEVVVMFGISVLFVHVNAASKTKAKFEAAIFVFALFVVVAFYLLAPDVSIDIATHFDTKLMVFFVLVGLMLVLVASESESNVDATISTLMLEVVVMFGIPM